MHRTRLGDLLVKYGAPPDRIDAALKDYYSRGKRFGEYALSIDACTAEQLNKALAEQAVEREDFDEAAKYTASNIEDAHRSILEHLDEARAQIKELIAGHKVK